MTVWFAWMCTNLSKTQRQLITARDEKWREKKTIRQVVQYSGEHIQPKLCMFPNIWTFDVCDDMATSTQMHHRRKNQKPHVCCVEYMAYGCTMYGQMIFNCAIVCDLRQINSRLTQLRQRIARSAKYIDYKYKARRFALLLLFIAHFISSLGVVLISILFTAKHTINENHFWRNCLLFACVLLGIPSAIGINMNRCCFGAYIFKIFKKKENKRCNEDRTKTFFSFFLSFENWSAISCAVRKFYSLEIVDK